MSQPTSPSRRRPAPPRLEGLERRDLPKVSQTGSRTALPAPNVNWAIETALDVQWAHAIAPQARILLVEASSAFGGDLMAAVDFARRQPGVSVVSMSWGSREFAGEA